MGVVRRYKTVLMDAADDGFLKGIIQEWTEIPVTGLIVDAVVDILPKLITAVLTKDRKQIRDVMFDLVYTSPTSPPYTPISPTYSEYESPPASPVGKRRKIE